MMHTIMAFGSCMQWHIYNANLIHEFKSFLTQQTSSSSKGSCSLTHKRSNRAIQVHAAKVYTTEFSNKNGHSAALEENANPQFCTIEQHKAHAYKD